MPQQLEFQDVRWIESRFDSKCRDCGDDIAAGDKVLFSVSLRKVYCKTCGEMIAPQTEAKKKTVQVNTAEVRETLRRRHAAHGSHYRR